MQVEEFEGVYRRHAAAVLGYARRCIGRSDIAEELAGEAFLELLQNIARIDTNQLPAWLYAVVKNRAIDYWRRSKLEMKTAARRREEVEPAAVEFDWGILERDGLNSAHRLCLILRYVHGMSREEIAEFTGLRENQVKGYLRYGLELLRRNLTGESGKRQK